MSSCFRTGRAKEFIVVPPAVKSFLGDLPVEQVNLANHEDDETHKDNDVDDEDSDKDDEVNKANHGDYNDSNKDDGVSEKEDEVDDYSTKVVT